MDKFKKTFPIDITFTNGEIPEVNKLNALVNATKNALSTLERFLGDGWDDSYPYFSTSDTLIQATKSALNSEIGDKKKSEMTSLSRLIGPASALNPKHLVNSTAREITESISANKNNIVLKYAPVNLTTLSFTDTAAFATRKSTPGSVLVAGDYYVNAFTGEVMTITPTVSGTVTYETTLSYLGYSSYPGASFNVIPSPEQATKCSCSGPVDGLYTITLPTITDQESNDLNTSTTLTSSELNYGLQLELPEVLNIMFAGDIIPDGFLYIRDDNTNQIYRSAVYYYYSQSQLKVGGVTLDTAHSYTILTVGTTITQSIQDLQSKLFKFRRGLDTIASIDISNIAGRTGPSANTSETRAEVYVQSEAPNNHFPQYLHRDGWFDNYDDGNINDQNGMRGDLVLLSTERQSNSRNNVDGDSYKLRFGSTTLGPYIYSNNPGPSNHGGISIYSSYQIDMLAPTKYYGLDERAYMYQFEGTENFDDGIGNATATLVIPTLEDKNILLMQVAIDFVSLGSGHYYFAGRKGSGTSDFSYIWTVSTGTLTIYAPDASVGDYTIKIFAIYQN